MDYSEDPFLIKSAFHILSTEKWAGEKRLIQLTLAIINALAGCNAFWCSFARICCSGQRIRAFIPKIRAMNTCIAIHGFIQIYFSILGNP